MKPNELSGKLAEYPSDKQIAIVEGVTNEHIYDFYANYIHICEGEDYFEISFELNFKTILKWFYRKVYWKVWSLFYKELMGKALANSQEVSTKVDNKELK